MSESGGGGGGATFSAPATATSGLQRYGLERPAKNLYPAPGVGIWERLRRAAARKRMQANGGRSGMKKGPTMNKDTISSMVGTLSESVSGIVSANAPNTAELLAKGFDEFKAELQKQVEGFVAAQEAATQEALAKAAPDGEEPLFKGMGTVGRVASLASMVARQVESITDGKDFPGEDGDADPASDEVVELLEHAVHAVELALRQAVNEHVVPIDDDEAEEADDDGALPDGAHLIVLKNFEAPDDDSAVILAKSALPSDLAAFATDPAFIAQGLLSLGAAAMEKGGVAAEDLEKVFLGGIDGEALAKEAGVMGGEDEMAQGKEGGADAGDDPLHMLGRLLAASLIQLNSIIEAVEGRGEEMEEPDGDEGAGGPGDGDGDESAMRGEGEGEDENKKPPFGKAAPTGELAKLSAELADLRKMLTEAKGAEVEKLEKTVGDLTARIAEMGRQPAPAKAVVGAGAAVTLTKSQDTGGIDNEAELMAEAERISKLAPMEKAVAIAKLVHKAGGQPLLKRVQQIDAKAD